MNKPKETIENNKLKSNDLYIGNLVNVHNKRAIIVDISFPLIYFSYENDHSIKHRNYLSSPEIFTKNLENININNKNYNIINFTPLKGTTISNFNEIYLDKLNIPKKINPEKFKDNIGEENILFNNYNGHQNTLSLTFLDSCFLYNCENSIFHIPETLKGLKLINDNNLTLSIFSVANKILISNCKDCIIKIFSYFPIVIITNSTNITFEFIDNQSVIIYMISCKKILIKSIYSDKDNKKKFCIFNSNEEMKPNAEYALKYVTKSKKFCMNLLKFNLNEADSCIE